MAWQGSDAGRALSAKIVVGGGFGVGKTTLVAAVSEIEVARNEALMTTASQSMDELAMTPGKATTTVGTDFGRITLRDEQGELVLFLFGTPGQSRFWFLWDDLVRGALGAVVLVDVRRLPDGWPSIDYFLSRGDIPLAVVVNPWDGRLTHHLDEIRDALSLPAQVPLLAADARDGAQVRGALGALIDHALICLQTA